MTVVPAVLPILIIDWIAYCQYASGKDLGAQASPVHQSQAHTFLHQLLKMRARFAQAQVPQCRRTDSKVFSDQMVERNAPGDEVSPGFLRVEVQAVIPLSPALKLENKSAIIITNTFRIQQAD